MFDLHHYYYHGGLWRTWSFTFHLQTSNKLEIFPFAFLWKYPFIENVTQQSCHTPLTRIGFDWNAHQLVSIGKYFHYQASCKKQTENQVPLKPSALPPHFLFIELQGDNLLREHHQHLTFRISKAACLGNTINMLSIGKMYVYDTLNNKILLQYTTIRYNKTRKR